MRYKVSVLDMMDFARYERTVFAENRAKAVALALTLAETEEPIALDYLETVKVDPVFS